MSSIQLNDVVILHKASSVNDLRLGLVVRIAPNGNCNVRFGDNVYRYYAPDLLKLVYRAPTPKPLPAPKPEVDYTKLQAGEVRVVARGNPNYTLGFIPRPSSSPMGRSYDFMLHKPVSVCSVFEDTPISDRVRRVCFEIERTVNGWDCEFVLAFSGVSGDLRYLRGFRLSGESPREASERQAYQY